MGGGGGGLEELVEGTPAECINIYDASPLPLLLRRLRSAHSAPFSLMQPSHFAHSPLAV